MDLAPVTQDLRVIILYEDTRIIRLLNKNLKCRCDIITPHFVCSAKMDGYNVSTLVQTTVPPLLTSALGGGHITAFSFHTFAEY